MEENKPEQEQKAIPSLSFNDNEIIVNTFEVPLNFNNSDIIIKMKKLTAGERRDLVKSNSNVKLVGTQTSGTVDSVGYIIGLLSRVIVEAPFPTDEKTISSFPEEVLEYLYDEYSSATSSKKKA